MGTKVQGKNYLPGYYSMRDLNEDSNNSCNWPLYYEDKSLTNGQYCNSLFPTATTDSDPGYDKDSVKQTMLEHEAEFKNQVNELHRIYRIQMDMMDGAKRKEHHMNRLPIGPSWSSSPLASQITSEEARKWANHGFPLLNSVYDRPSTSGIEVIHSPLSSMEGTNMNTGPYSSRNGCSSKEIEVLESRPTKVQRKLFDLKLPAEEYVDIEEEKRVCNGKVSAIPSSYPGSNFEMALKNNVKFNGKDARNTDSDSVLRRPNGLVDLNEPFQLDDVHESNVSSYDFCTGTTHGSAQLCKPNPQPYESDVDTRRNKHLDKFENGRGWLSHVPDVEQQRSNIQSLPRFLRTELQHSSQQPQGSSSNVYERTFCRSEKSNGDIWKDGKVFGAEISKRAPDQVDSKSLGLLSDSNVTDSYQVSPSNLAWEKPSTGFNHSQISAHASEGLNAVSVINGSHSFVQSDGIFGDRWYRNKITNSNSGFGGESKSRNGFNQGPLSGTREQPIQIPSCSVDYGFAKCRVASNGANMKKSRKEMNLNEAISESSSDQETVVCDNESLEEKKREDHLSALPWLRHKPMDAVQLLEVRSQHIAESVQSIPTDFLGNKKLLGSPILEKPNVDLKIESDNKSVEKKPKISFDMNLPIDPEQNDEENAATVEKITTESKPPSFKHLIDLNTCFNENGDESDSDEVIISSKPSSPITRGKALIDIDLETPANPEEENSEELITAAAEAILSLSAARKSPLEWFAEIIVSCVELEEEEENDSSEESDFFESMVLRLAETKEEDYIMPSSSSSLVEPAACPTSNRTGPRRGQGRRGKKRRDFQRDILPGLASLSRHEVSQDLQTLGGGPTRRTAGRGRRQLAKVCPNPNPNPIIPNLTVETVSEDHRSFAGGWGKTTRRPRRQRCPTAAANTATNTTTTTLVPLN